MGRAVVAGIDADAGECVSAFEDQGEALAHADAESCDAGAGAAAGELVGDGAGEAGAGGTQGVAEGDRAACG